MARRRKSVAGDPGGTDIGRLVIRRRPSLWLCGVSLVVVGCAGQARFASRVAPLSGCYAFEYGPWPPDVADSGADTAHPSPNALPAVVELRTERVGMVGLGRMALSYPTLPADVLAGRSLDQKLICRTFSDCTTGPRIGEPSGCYPLDDHYKKSESRVAIAAAKKEKRNKTG